MSIYESFYGKEIEQIATQFRNINSTNIEAYPEDLKEPSDDILILENVSEPEIENRETAAPILLTTNEEEDLNSLEGNVIDLPSCLTLNL